MLTGVTRLDCGLVMQWNGRSRANWTVDATDRSLPRAEGRGDRQDEIVLEPIVSLEVLCPEASMGDVAGDLSSRRGQVTGTTGITGRNVERQRDRAAF